MLSFKQTTAKLKFPILILEVHIPKPKQVPCAVDMKIRRIIHTEGRRGGYLFHYKYMSF